MRAFIILFVASIAFSPLYAQNRRDSLLVFVGEKIDVTYAPEQPREHTLEKVIIGKDTVMGRKASLSMDGRYAAKYRIVDLVYGKYKKDTIEFIAFDHYGKPGFANFRNVLLFVSYFKGRLYHEKYQYFDLYLTRDGRWASPYPAYDYNHPYKDSVTVKPERIEFQREISFPLESLTDEAINQRYPKPYFEIKDGRAIAIYGNYVNDLFKLKQQTILKARGIF